jgi:DNA replication protein DnaC
MEKSFEQIMQEREPYFEERPLAEDEVLGEDGLIHCRLCGGPRQSMIELFGRRQKMPSDCTCQKEKKEKSDRDFKRFQRYYQLAEWRIDYSESWSLCRFEQDDGRDVNAATKAKAYVRHFDEMYTSDTGLMLIGSVGCGKTFLAACIMKALDDERSVSMTTLPRLIAKLNDGFGRDRAEILRKIEGTDLLIIDDFGIERTTEYSMEQSYEVIDTRYRSGKPLIITTNLTLQQLQEEQNLALRRIYDRVIEKCIPLLVKGESRRGEIAGEKRREAMRVLGMG